MRSSAENRRRSFCGGTDHRAARANVRVAFIDRGLLDDRAERAEVDAAYVVKRLQDEAENAESDSARVQALGLLARHLGMLKDKVETTEVRPTTKLIVLPPEGEEDLVRGEVPEEVHEPDLKLKVG